MKGSGGEFFAEVTAELTSAADHVMQVILRAQAAEDASLSCGIHIEGAHQEHIELCRALTDFPGECVGGQASLEATLLYKEGKWEQAVIERLEGQEIRWYFPEDSLYREPLGSVDLDWLQLRQIDPPRRPCQFGNGAPRSERAQSALRFCFVSQSPSPPNLMVRGINFLPEFSSTC
jgi:hypothetical protein